MSLRPVRIICPGATAGGVVAAILFGAGARFTAAPQGDGRWVIETKVADATASLLTLRGGEPLVLEAVVEEVPDVEDATPPATEEASASEEPPPPPTDVVDRVGFVANTIPAAKRAAVRAAKGFGAMPYPGEDWEFDGERFSRRGYRSKRPGAIVFGAAEDGNWWVGWRPASPA